MNILYPRLGDKAGDPSPPWPLSEQCYPSPHIWWPGWRPVLFRILAVPHFGHLGKQLQSGGRGSLLGPEPTKSPPQPEHLLSSGTREPQKSCSRAHPGLQQPQSRHGDHSYPRLLHELLSPSLVALGLHQPSRNLSPAWPPALPGVAGPLSGRGLPEEHCTQKPPPYASRVFRSCSTCLASRPAERSRKAQAPAARGKPAAAAKAKGWLRADPCSPPRSSASVSLTQGRDGLRKIPKQTNTGKDIMVARRL